ncbi:uncharacterized protein LOC121727070 [Aricia agestis]|uniref:uncharacterized protein LOC121727070 n=1 Tax=Aricia agestis TaxID=91739 RepID=UPI001C209626|nr:uncharacterized protein LOC121727070 [Aricia agestis]
MWRNLFLLIFVFLQVLDCNSALRRGDRGVCVRKGRLACCAKWKYVGGSCLPVCTFGCGEGRCIGPELCECDKPLTYRNKKCEQPKCNLKYCINPNCSYNDEHKMDCNCSDGYEYMGDYSCIPKCTGGCANGECVAPDECSCSEGYRSVSSLECAPICHNCENGECTAPHTCSCKDGYTKRDDRCQPVCHDCEHGECVAPDTCRCHDGYQNDGDGKCKPICHNCDNGDCIAPRDCRCREGYEKGDDTCSPICFNCTNGECVSPGVCECRTGYERVSDECVPHCESCVNGYCSAPGMCTCDKGYQKDEEGACKPFCSKECVNATCVGPDVCECLDGYIKSNEFMCKPKCACDNGKCIESNGASICMCNEGYNMKNGLCVPVCSKECVNGVCTKPDTCVCEEGYSSNSTHSWICTKPCVPCDHGVCNTHGECVCYPGYEYTNDSCTPMIVNCDACESFCNDTGCWCNDSRRCDKPIKAGIDSEPTSTGLAGLQILWLGGAIGAIVLVTTVIFIFRHMWKRQQELRSKEIGADTYPYGSVAYTVPGTLQNATTAVSVPNLYSEDNDDEVEEAYEEEDEKAAENGLLPANDLDNDVICTKRSIFTKLVSETQWRYITTTYQGRWCLRRPCIKTRQSLVQHETMVQKTVVQIKKFCCDGYMTNATSLRLQCDPVCVPSCESGYCSQPGVCTCNEGYVPSPESNRKCNPICSKNCEHGTCVEPEKCMCDFGYHSVNEICVPICNNPCIYGICVAPDRCECLPGYINNGTETCYPYCSNDCPHGTCVSPENCVCDEGWHKKEPDALCEPICTQDCGHGTCVAPDTCECFEHYIKSENGTCVPFCTSGCPHGSCVGPENCTCDNGWLKTEPDGVCEPVCENGCEHGTCVSPNECQCSPYYNKSDDGLCVPYCSSGCPHGSCVAPEICECDEGWSINGIECKPVCDPACGNGTCMATNICLCYPGYDNTTDTNSSFQANDVCMPKCHNCDGKCVAPDQCVCDSPLVAVSVALDGTPCDCFEYCWDGTKLCDRTICVEGSTTTDITDYSEDFSSTYNIDVTFGDDVATGLSDLDDESTESFTNDTTNVASMTISQHIGIPEWIYIIAAVALISIIALVILVVKRKAISSYFDKGDYHVKGNKEEETNETLSKEGVQYSDLLKNKTTV